MRRRPADGMSLKDKAKNALPAFGQRNFRLFWSGQAVSLIGTHMQTVALGWLVLRISNSPFYLGLVNAVGTLPILLFSMFAGMIADRTNKRRLILLTQSAFLVQALALAILVFSGRAAVWNLMLLAVVQGAIHSFDAPTRQSFVSEMVPPETVMSAVALNSSVFNGARILGPAVAGFLIHAAGEAGCFFINAASFAAVIAGIALMRESELFRTAAPPKKAPMAELKEGFRYVRNEPRISGLLAGMIVISLFGMPSLMLLPVFAKDVLQVGAKGMGFLFSAAGGGALASMLALAFVKRPRGQGLKILIGSAVFAVGAIAFSQSENFYFSMAAIAVVGAGLTSGVAMTNSALQTIAPPHIRGRVMGMYIFVFLGMMPPGSFLVGLAAQYLGAPTTVLCAGALTLVLLASITILFPAILKIDAPSVEQ